MKTYTQPSKNIHLLGHRGARGECFENSRQGFEHVLALANDSMFNKATFNTYNYDKCRLVGIEFDVQVSKDGVVVVFHDDSLDRLYQRQGRIDQLSYLEITRLTSDSHAVLRLNDMPPLLIGYEHIELEIKTHPRTNYQLLINSLADTLAPLDANSAFAGLPITLTSFDLTLHQLLHAHPVLSGYPRGMLVEPVLPKTLANLTNDMHAQASDLQLTTSVAGNTNLYDIPYIAMRLGCERVGLYHALYDAKFVSLCQRFGIHTSAWTVNDWYEVIRLADIDVDHIITDYPSIMLTR